MKWRELLWCNFNKNSGKSVFNCQYQDVKPEETQLMIFLIEAFQITSKPQSFLASGPGQLWGLHTAQCKQRRTKQRPVASWSSNAIWVSNISRTDILENITHITQQFKHEYPFGTRPECPIDANEWIFCAFANKNLIMMISFLKKSEGL